MIKYLTGHLLGAVPVLVIFTKMDALDSKAWNKLIVQNMSREEAKQQAPEHSLSIAKDHLNQLLDMRYPPKGSVYMRGMVTALMIHSNTLIRIHLRYE
jgi:hypothetical protein